MASVAYHLEELEGDHHTFLYKDNILKLADSGKIARELVEPIAIIREQIDAIEDSLWNPLDFIDNIKWRQVRELVLDLFKKEMVN